jgi:hypothetical protein
MITEPSSTVVPPDVFETIATLNGQVEHLKTELAQALEIWQSTLADEKKKFEDLLVRKELAFQEQESQWGRQSQAYEERLFELQSEFESRAKQAEQNATRALHELDDNWQRDKLEWGPIAQTEWRAQKQELETRAQALEQDLVQLKKERAEQPVIVNDSAPTSETVQALQNQLTQFQQTVATLQNQTSPSEEWVNACLQALDYQISVLYDLVQSKLIS